MNTKKILILTLGKGQRENDEQKAVPYPYKEVTYRLRQDDGQEICCRSPFVADALIESVKPDSIVLIGTVKSAWDAFYYRFHRDGAEGFEKNWEYLKELSDRYGKETADREIDDYRERVKEIFAEELAIAGHLAIPKNPQIEICLVKYGLDHDELEDTYARIMAAVKPVLDNKDSDGKIEISIDMTHSFRSMPIYNLAVLNYLRVLLARNFAIAHVFYGNLDVRGENDNIAEIVDLKDVVDILEITHGVSEFLNAGNAATLLQWLDCDPSRSNGDPFVNALRSFDEALKMSDRGGIQNALSELLKEEVNDETALSDAKELIRNNLGKKISVADSTDPVEKQRQTARFQIDLAGWLLELGQIGLAAAIAKEGFRSFLVSIYDENNPEKFEDENRRKRAEQMFGVKLKELKDRKLYQDYCAIEKKASEIRNRYAHNLIFSAVSDEYGTTDRYSDDLDIVTEYLKCIRDIMKEGDCLRAENKNRNRKKSDGKNISILITNEENREILKKYQDIINKNTAGADKKMHIYLPVGGKLEMKGSKTIFIQAAAKKIAAMILGFADEIGPDNVKRIYWGEDMEPSLRFGCSYLIKSFLLMKNENDNILYLAINADRESEEELKMIWRLDAGQELSDDELDKQQLQLKRDNIRLEELMPIV